MVKTFKLIVGTTANSIDILKFLKKNIKSINAMGVKIVIEKVSTRDFNQTMVDTLKSRGVTRLPAMIAPDGKTFIGKKSIIGIFTKNLNSKRGRDIASPVAPPPVDDVNSYMMGLMYSGMDEKGKMIPRNDADAPEDDAKSEIETRLREYQMGGAQPRRAGGGGMNGGSSGGNDYGGGDDYHGGGNDTRFDNIAGDQPMNAPINMPHIDDDMDRKMMSAFLDNVPVDY